MSGRFFCDTFSHPRKRSFEKPTVSKTNQAGATRSIADVLSILAEDNTGNNGHGAGDDNDDDDDADDGGFVVVEEPTTTTRSFKMPQRNTAPSAPRISEQGITSTTKTPNTLNRPAGTSVLQGPIRWPLRGDIPPYASLQASIPERFQNARHYVETYSGCIRELVNLSVVKCADILYNKPKEISSLELHRGAQLTHREWRGQKGKLNISLRLELNSNSWRQISKGDHQKDDIWALSFNGRFDDAFLVRAVFSGVSNDGSLGVELMPDNLPAKAPLPRGAVSALRIISASTELQELLALSQFDEGDPLCQQIVLPTRPGGGKAGPLPPFPPSLENVGVAEVLVAQRKVVERFRLNEDQRHALNVVGSWFRGTAVQSPDICLIHGVFGSGKSQLLVAMILFMVALMTGDEEIGGGGGGDFVDDVDLDLVGLDDAGEDGDDPDREPVPKKRVAATARDRKKKSLPFRIAISSATNTAVDRILCELIECGFTDFLRVGSLKKMSRKVLPFTLYEEEKDAIKELQRSLKFDDLTPQEQGDLQNELEELRSGRAGKRKERLHVTPVVGTTCNASMFKLFKDQCFEVLLLDEASQMIEPLSLLPIKAFKPRKLLVVGDPMQLAPPLPSSGAKNARDLSLALFSRLAPHYAPIVLRTQYRCHPRIANLASELFYGGALNCGITGADRPSLLPYALNLGEGAAPDANAMLFLDSAGLGNTSTDPHCNPMHTKIASLVLQRISAEWTSAETMATRVGVIALFRAQVKDLRATLNKYPLLQNVRVSTVDAFQGAENDVILVVTSSGQGASFVGDVRRLNVTLTRARNHIIIIGRRQELQGKTREWDALIQACTIRDAASFLME